MTSIAMEVNKENAATWDYIIRTKTTEPLNLKQSLTHSYA